MNFNKYHIGWAALGAALFIGPMLTAGCSAPRALDADAMVSEWQIRNAGDRKEFQYE